MPARIVLRWDRSARSCSVLLGNRNVGRDLKGMEGARSLLRALKQMGPLMAEIDSEGDVPVRWVVEALNLLKSEDAARIHFTGAQDPLGRARSDP